MAVPPRDRHGSWSGRGYRYQDAITAYISLLVATGRLAGTLVIPEGEDDAAIRSPGGDRLIQIKSRRASARTITVAEIAQHLRDLWRRHQARAKHDPRIRMVLIVERLPETWSETTWASTLTDAALATQAQELRSALRDMDTADTAIDDLLGRTSIVHGADVEALSIALLQEHLGLLAEACTPHLHALVIEMGELASDNGDRSDDDLVGRTPADIQRLLDNVTSRVDIDGLAEALSRGLCHHVDFSTPVTEPSFYMGVDVIPGHIAAGLVLPIPELLEEATTVLLDQRVLLVTGPSGAGKSAFAWQAAHRTAGSILWFRSSRLTDDDVGPVLRLLRGARGGATQRVGLVVDDLGRSGTAGWDRLVRESAHDDSIHLLGIVRQEDLPTLETATTLERVRPYLTEELARDIWQRLRDDELTSWSGWLEPYHHSDALVLEYVHELTEGERLGATIAAQMRARLVDPSRDLETRLLRLVAVAHVCGLSIPISALSGALGADDEDVRRAVLRCVDEHLVRAVDNELSGLHELRSLAIARATHDPPPPVTADTVTVLIRLCSAENLGRLCAPAVSRGFITPEALTQALSDRLTDEGSIGELAAALQGLHMVGVAQRAKRWDEAMQACGVPPAHRGLAASLSLTSSEPLPMLMPTVQRAVKELRRLPQEDIRGELAACLSEGDVQALWAKPWSLSDAHGLLVALVAANASRIVEAGQDELGRRMQSAALDTIAALLSTARRMDEPLALRLLEAMGGESAIVARLSGEVAWLRDLAIEDDGGVRMLRGHYVNVSKSQRDVHGAVVDACRFALELLPTLERADIGAVDASGQLAGFGDHVLANKTLSRSAAPARLDVMLNRQILAAVDAQTAAPTLTARLAIELSVVDEAANVIDQAGERYIREEPLPPEMVDAADRLVRLAEEAATAPAESPTPGPDTVLKDRSSAATAIGIHVGRNLLPRLFGAAPNAGSLAGYLAGNLVPLARQLAIPERWSLLDGDGPEQSQRLLRALLDLHAVLAEANAGGATSSSKISQRVRGARNAPVLTLAAKRARQLAGSRLRQRVRRLQARLARDGNTARVITAPVEVGEAIEWPPTELLVLVDVPSLLYYYQELDATQAVCRSVLGDLAAFYIAPMRRGRLVATDVYRVIRDRFPHTVPDGWLPEGNLPATLDQPTAVAYQACIEAIVELSGILSAWVDGDRPRAEAAALEAATDTLDEAHNAFTQLLTAGDPVMDQARGVVAYLADSIRDEAALRQNGEVPSDSIAAAFISAMCHGQSSDLIGLVSGARILLTEWAVDPEGAREILRSLS